MARLLLCCVLLALSVNVASSSNLLSVLLAFLTTTVEQWLHIGVGTCSTSYFQTLATKNYALNTTGKYAQFQAQSTVLPLVDTFLMNFLVNLPCNAPVIKNPTSSNSCGFNWGFDGKKWCFCNGTVGCPPSSSTAATTKATTTTPTTTSTSTTKTTSTSTTAATTTAKSATTPALTTPTTPAAPVAAAPSVGNAGASNTNPGGRQPVVITTLITSYPAPVQVTLSNALYTVQMTGQQQASPANTFLYTGVLYGVDSSFNGAWTVTAVNSIGSTVKSLTLAVNFENEVISQGFAINPFVTTLSPSSGLIAFQTYTCDNWFLSFLPANYDQGLYATQGYFAVDFNVDLPGQFLIWINGQPDSSYPNPPDCPNTGTSSSAPFWLFLQYTQDTSNALTLDVWSTPQGMFYQSSQNATGLQQVQPYNLGYPAQEFAFDLDVGSSSQQLIYYPTAQ